jgi:peptide subunit release factor RF-3
MEIEVLFSNFTQIQINDVVNYYNKYKKVGRDNLEILDKIEYGFRIKLKQLRWYKNKLISNSFQFNNEETFLLYESLCDVFGEKNIILHINKIDEVYNQKHVDYDKIYNIWRKIKISHKIKI